MSGWIGSCMRKLSSALSELFDCVRVRFCRVWGVAGWLVLTGARMGWFWGEGWLDCKRSPGS